MHIISVGSQGQGLLGMAYLGVVTVCLLWCHRVWALLLLAAVQVCELWTCLPFTSNHWLTTGFINATILLGYGYAILKSKLLRAKSPLAEGAKNDATFAGIEPVLRGLIFVLYFYAVFHKLNFDFFNPEWTCAKALPEALLHRISSDSSIPEPLSKISIVATLVVETLIPVLLLIPRTRFLGVAVGVGFHTMLAGVPFARYYNFSSMLLALLLLFATSEDLKRFLDVSQGFINRMMPKALRTFDQVKLLRVSLLGIAVLVSLISNHAVVRSKLGGYTALPYLAFGFSALAALATVIFQKKARSSQPIGWKASPLGLWGMVFLYFLSGASPYLGLKTELSLSMYSNLTTEGTYSNHVLVRKPLDLFGWQNDSVRILDSSSPFLRMRIDRHEAMTWFEFSDYMARNPMESVRYRRNGEVVEVFAGAARTQHFETQPVLLRKFVFFRPFRYDQPQTCVH